MDIALVDKGLLVNDPIVRPLTPVVSWMLLKKLKDGIGSCDSELNKKVIIFVCRCKCVCSGLIV